ncbi:MAG: ferrous iron transport protein A [Clostridia bacterium]|nr:ferrous iron transport protein A [Clostridia bacterium]MBQ8762061.1 ferrous iron transport protein A [Clostridia bacterium]
MTLDVCDKNKTCKIVSINLQDQKLKLRLYEIGFFVGAYAKVLNKSGLKKTLLVQVLDSCFIIKTHIAKFVEVEYE